MDSATNAIPVSYTHLDVYKRQVPECRGEQAKLVQPKRHVDERIPKRRVVFAVSGVLTAVSYTHLDVYKRQVPDRAG